MCLAVLRGERLSASTGAPWAPVVLVLLAHAGALLALWRHTVPGGMWSRAAFGVPLLGVVARFYLPTVQAGLPSFSTVTMRREEAALVAVMRELSASQEQFRLGSGTYASDIDQLQFTRQLPVRVAWHLRASGDTGWSAVAGANGATCKLWVRDVRLRQEPDQPEGVPYCQVKRSGENNQHVGTVLAEGQAPSQPFELAEVKGEWLQHRADAHRTGVSRDVTSSAGFSWTAKIGGELRSSAAIVGGQVFVGAHGNGELVALHLESGRLAWRVRTPNWIHHEPAVDSSLVVVGFGNNEEWLWNPLSLRPKSSSAAMGSDPSGVIAYDRRSGVERWRSYTPGPVMLTPALHRGVAVVQALDSLVIGISLRNGKRLWSTAVPGSAPMGNPLLLGDTVVVSLDAGQVCRLLVSNGQLLSCSSLPDSRGYAGHASPAAADSMIVATGLDFATATQPGSRPLLQRVRGMFVQSPRPAPMVVPLAYGVDARRGFVRWVRRLEAPSYSAPAGHTAGTPVIDGDVAYVTFPTTGRIIALNLADGAVRWTASERPSRGSVTVLSGAVMSATAGAGWVVLDAATGAIRCRTRLPAQADRAGLSIRGATGILTLNDGVVLARPINRWLACQI
jgi:outer membrane protein assembly factor BamB